MSMRSIGGWTLILGMASAFAETPANQVHPDFKLEEVKLPARYKTMGMDFLPDGRMVLGVIETVGMGEVPPADTGNKVLLISGLGSKPENVSVKEVSRTWNQISGVTVAEGKVYVSDRDGWYRLDDLAAPAQPAANRTLMMKWPDEKTWRSGFMWHQWVFQPLYWQGRFFAPYSGCISPGGWSNTEPTTHLSGAFLTWDLKNLDVQALAGGLRSPNGANVDPANGEIFVTDNQGSYLPASTFMRIKPGRFYGHRQIPEMKNDSGTLVYHYPPNFAENLPYDPPVAWLPYHNALRRSPSQPLVLRTGRYKGDWLIGDVNSPGLVRVYLDRVDSAINGAVFWFTQGMQNSAVNRMVYGPDSAIYIGTMMKGIGNWPGLDKSPLYRLTSKSTSEAFDMAAIRSLKDGLEIEFTEAVKAAAFGADSVKAAQWQYIRKPEYGQGKQEDESLDVSKAEISDDGRRIHLVIDGLKTDRVVYVKLVGLKSESGKSLWNNEGWLTLNAVSDHGWNPAGTSAVRAFVPPAAFPARLRSLATGSLQVTLENAGPYAVSLHALDGTLLDFRSGVGPGPAELFPRRHGVFLVKIRTGGLACARKIAL
jgi:hypothetical protein